MSYSLFRRTLIFAAILVLFGVIPTVYFISTTPYSYGFYSHWTPCFTYIDDGTFWSGQPYCESGGPLLFFVPYFFYKLVGESYFQLTMFIVTLVINILLFYIGLLILKKERAGKEKLGNETLEDEVSLYFYLSFFLSLVYLNTLSRFDSSFSLFFFVLSCYWLKWKIFNQDEPFFYKYGLVGTFFAIAALTKVTTILPFFLFIVWLLFVDQQHITFAKQKLTISRFSLLLKKFFFIFIPSLISYAFFQLLYPNLYKYVFLLFLGPAPQKITFFEVFRLFFLFSPDFYSLVFSPLLFLSFYVLYYFYSNRNILSWFLGPSLFLYTILMAHTTGILSYFRYWLPFFYFVPLFLVLTYRKNVIYTTVFSCLVFLLLVFPTGNDTYYNAYVSYDFLSAERTEFLRAIHPYFSLLSHEEKILVEFGEDYNYYLSLYGINLSSDKVLSLNRWYGKGSPDANILPSYQLLFGSDLQYDQNDVALSSREQAVINEILADNFSVIYFGPPDWAVTSRLLPYTSQKLSTYCSFVVPSNVWLTEAGKHDAVLFFRNQTHCLDFSNKTVSMYITSWDTICNKDEFSANLISKILSRNGFSFDFNCTSAQQGLSSFNILIPRFYFFYMIMFGAVFFILLFFSPKIYSKGVSNQKFLFFIILFFLLFTLFLSNFLKSFI